ncbi:unnamed protein product, partial [marine sediment metagenome]
GNLYYPSSVSLTITSPCGITLVNAQSMTSNAAGIYSYGYQLLGTAIYGEYHVSVKTEYSSATNIDVDKFFVMPWNIVDEIRTYSQQGTKKISDDDLSLISWNSFKEVIQRVSEFHFHEKLCTCIDGTCCCNADIECGCNCTSPICSDGYQLKNTPIMDFQFDSNVHGCECDDTLDECHNDICGIWVDNAGLCSNISVEVIDATCGHIKVYKDDCVTAIPADNKGIFVNYHSTWKSYNSQLFKKAVVYLATYEVAMITNLSSKKVSGCDERGRVSFTQLLWDNYMRIIEGISRPNIVGGR